MEEAKDCLKNLFGVKRQPAGKGHQSLTNSGNLKPGGRGSGDRLAATSHRRKGRVECDSIFGDIVSIDMISSDLLYIPCVSPLESVAMMSLEQ